MNRYKAVFILSLMGVASVFAADEIHWTITGQGSVTFDWRGSVQENTIIYGTSPGVYSHKIVAVNPKPLPSSSNGPFWEAKLTGLHENTLYYYVIGNRAEHTFRTPLPRGSSGFKVDVEGDIGSSRSYSQVSGVQALIAKDLPHFVLAVGDLSYGDRKGAKEVDCHFNDVMVWSQEAAYMPTWGNHDWDVSPDRWAHLNEYEGRFDLPHSQTSPGAETAIGNGPGEDWYWFDYGNVRFIAYPEPYSADSWADWNTKAKALMDDAQADSDIDFIVTFGHRPAYSSGVHSNSPTVKGWVKRELHCLFNLTGNFSGSPVLKNFLDTLGDTHSKYVLNINGHSHNYERGYPQHGVVHLTVGTGGASLEIDDSCLWKIKKKPYWSDFRAIHHGITQLTFTKTGIHGAFICGPREEGKSDIACNTGDVVDTFIIGVPGDARRGSSSIR
jgi:hypothetical protein